MNLNMNVAVVTVTLLHIPVLAFAHVEALLCALLDRLLQLHPHYHVQSLSSRLKLSVLLDERGHGPKNQQRRRLVSLMMYLKPVELASSIDDELATKTSLISLLSIRTIENLSIVACAVLSLPFFFSLENLWRNDVLT
jgi:hypothetical protein